MRVLLVVYDNASYVPYFPQGLGYIASALLNAGIDVEIYNQDFHHYPEEHLTEYLNNNRFDVVGCGVIGGYYQYRKLIAISTAINKSQNRPFYLLGGHGPSPDPEYFIKKTGADAIVIGEGEITVVELMKAVSSHKDLSRIKGIAYRDNNTVKINPRRDLIEDIDKIPMPAYKLFPMEFYRMVRETNCSSSDFLMPILSGRGCTFKCNFCYRMDKGFRPRSDDSIIEEIHFLKENYYINYIIFSDELLMSSIPRTEQLCNAIIKSRLNIKWWCNGRLNYAKPDILKLMKRAGCVFVNYGIEAFDDIALKKMKKALNTRQIVSGVEATLAAGISPGLNIIWGNIGEDASTLRKGVEFLKKYGDASILRTIRPVTPYPGSPLYDYARKNGLLKDIEEFYEVKHINSDLLAVNFTSLSDDEFHKELHKANLDLIDDYYMKRKRMTYQDTKKLYTEKNVNFRGYRQL
ncbi:MAG: B12-binding domain-containing radical SAM protein [Kiritimatiellae bacterium]|nr:B12-binding domain-containing radical SAM protein [Kiritimatiellia bacterium]